MASKYNNGVESDAMRDLRRRREALDERNSKLTMEEMREYERKAKEEFLAGSNIVLIPVEPAPHRESERQHVEMVGCIE